ncbi:TetR/AcrR family transcriptional regulator [Streptomyces boncukensis]|uniref:TetR/AcrR family transcriptional regulator n=1 Tax=Streptomyces boncukensis TaxID=2711219 RepID=A0A6G4WWX9_9ACTN|nr:TetR/AcrR family transcriptional regulator [Streptomyces boncukensis]NGO68961.1 TetR/AcrR family transcriptional regulator [Streptomyces boncukensis]
MKTGPYHHGELRAALLERAEETLRRKGPDALSLRELAREAGVSPGAPRHHFKTKQALLDALALDGFNRIVATLNGALAGAGDTFADRLTATAYAYVRFARDHTALLELAYSSKHDPAATEELVAATQRLSDVLTDLVRHGQRSGEVREGPVERMKVPIIAMLQGFAAFAASRAIDAEQVQQELDDTIAILLRGYAP